MSSLLLEHIDTLATFDDQRHRLRNAWVLVQDNVVAGVGSFGTEPAQVDRRIDLSGHIVLPGLINTHHHNFQTLLRNIPSHAKRIAFPLAARSLPVDERGEGRGPVCSHHGSACRATAFGLHDQRGPQLPQGQRHAVRNRNPGSPGNRDTFSPGTRQLLHRAEPGRASARPHRRR